MHDGADSVARQQGEDGRIMMVSHSFAALLIVVTAASASAQPTG
jgi:hypothetical protein